MGSPTEFHSSMSRDGGKNRQNVKALYGVVGAGAIVLCGIIIIFCFIRRRRERVIATLALPLQTRNKVDESSDEEEIIMFKNKRL